MHWTAEKLCFSKKPSATEYFLDTEDFLLVRVTVNAYILFYFLSLYELL